MSGRFFRREGAIIGMRNTESGIKKKGGRADGPIWSWAISHSRPASPGA